MNELGRDIIADTYTDCTPLDKYENADEWWADVKRRYAQHKKFWTKEYAKRQSEHDKLTAEAEELEKQIAQENENN